MKDMAPRDAPRDLELWAGYECSIVRLHGAYRNQLDYTGHARRISDIDALADLGVKTIRFPILWEQVYAGSVPDWSWPDLFLERVRQRGIVPIAGLLHHGSGPEFTGLCDPGFPELFARYAAEVASRYPWIDHFTPINEPLTTARFSCLYGHWYPHHTSTASFLRALIQQCQGVVLAMRAIRRINPNAKLVQTEDLGKVFSTSSLTDQADYENHRRWISLDLLCGRVDRNHPMHEELLAHGIAQSALDAFNAEPCPPDVIGINHYLTSDRYLDENVDKYPTDSWGGNGRIRYADIAACRSSVDDGQLGAAARLREAWERYQLPLALTEVHNGSTREEQLRWFDKLWKAARQVRSEGVDIRAVTAWAAAGSVDWSSLLTRRENQYEAGLFDIRGTPPRPTIIASACASLAADGKFDHPLLDDRGWWERDDRYHSQDRSQQVKPRSERKILIVGQMGTLGTALASACRRRHIAHTGLGRSQMDITDAAGVREVIEHLRPWAVINAAGFVRVKQAESMASQCMRENADGPQHLAAACTRMGIPFATFSSDLVFGGCEIKRYKEDDPTSPQCIYGQSKALAETRVRAANPDALIIRTSAFFGHDQYNFLHHALGALSCGRPARASDAIRVSPTYVPDLADATLDLLIDGGMGIWHLANDGIMSWYELAEKAARAAQVSSRGLELDFSRDPRCTALTSERGIFMPAIDDAIERFAHRRKMLLSA